MREGLVNAVPLGVQREGTDGSIRIRCSTMPKLLNKEAYVRARLSVQGLRWGVCTFLRHKDLPSQAR